MALQTKPVVDERTAAQQVELMKEIGKNISARIVNGEPPAWHLKYLEDREKAVAKGEDSFITLDEFEEDFRSVLK